VLYLNSSIGTFTPSPYLDAHGEVALSMRYFCFDAEVVLTVVEVVVNSFIMHS
jgi:Proteolysis_6 C-terminal